MQRRVGRSLRRRRSPPPVARSPPKGAPRAARHKPQVAERVRLSPARHHYVRLLLVQQLLRRWQRRRSAHRRRPQTQEAGPECHRADRLRAAAAGAARQRRRRPRQEGDQRRRLQGAPGLRLEPCPNDHQVSICELSIFYRIFHLLEFYAG